MTDDRAPGAPRSGSVQRLFDETRRRLVETGTRNRLVHVNRANTRGNVVNIVNERSDEVHGLLCSGKAMRFRALGRDAARGAGDIVLADEADAPIEAERYTDNHLETRLGPDGLSKKLLAIAREAARRARDFAAADEKRDALAVLGWDVRDTPEGPQLVPRR